MEIPQSAALKDFDRELADIHMRGQWTADSTRRTDSKEPDRFGIRAEPKSAGIPYVWKWRDVYPKLIKACEALPESNTARRALAFKNPELPRCTAQTLNMAIQVIRPGEIAWAHRHTIAAIRFVILGNEKLFTVVNGIACRMEENDLVLTPSWTWHDHRNESDELTCWLDVLDVPFVGGLNMGFYEELGNSTQSIRGWSEPKSPMATSLYCGTESAWGNSYRFSGEEVQATLNRLAPSESCPYDGTVFEYERGISNGSTLPTLSCRMQRLKPGFFGRRRRQTSSTVYHVVSGEGATEAGTRIMRWSTRDSFVVPNWTWYRHVNPSRTTEAVLFSVTDAPALRTLGFYRDEAEQHSDR